MQTDIQQEWLLYEQGKTYNHRLHPSYYQTVDKNYRFYSNDQWYGVVSNGLPTPVFNIFKQIIDYKIQSIMSQKVTMKYGVENIPDGTQDANEQKLQQTADMISGYSEVKWEKLKMDTLLRKGLLDAAISGDMCAYTYWDESIDTGSTNGINPSTDKPAKVMGDFCTELVDGSNVMFGNPNSSNAQCQPYILIVGREMVSKLKEEAKANKIPINLIDKIASDVDTLEQAGDRGKIEIDNKGDNGKCLYIIKLWKDKGKIMMKKVTKYCPIKNDNDLGLTLYPIAWMNWSDLKNSYHGQAEGTGLVPNQILINQMFAMIAYFMRMAAFGKVIYDKTRIAAWNNAVGSSIGVDGDVTGAVQQLNPGQMNTMIMQAFDKAVSLTKELCGANDAALGQIDPKNTSAIIAVQKASAVPLEGIKQNLYQFVEDVGLIWLDFMKNKYQVDRKISYKTGDVVKTGSFNGSDNKDVPFNLKIDVGPSSYWSEISSMQTLDNLLQTQKINFIQYLERIPNGIIPKKQELIDEINQTQQDNNLLYEQMAQFIQNLPPQIQQQLEALRQKNPQEYENQVKQLMSQQGGNQIG
jgi:hypothetical protein